MNSKKSEIRVLFAPDSDPMLLVSEAGARTLVKNIQTLLSDSILSVRIEIDSEGSPTPYQEFLNAIKILLNESESNSGACTISGQRELELSLSTPMLQKLFTDISTLDDSDHVHLYSSPVALVVSIDNSYYEERLYSSNEDGAG